MAIDHQSSPHKRHVALFAMQAKNTQTHTFSSSFRWESNSPVQFRFPAPLSGPAGSHAWTLFPVLSATAAVWVEQLCVGTHAVCSSAEWWHCTVALSATEGPFVSPGTQASYTQHNETVQFLTIMRERVWGAV